MLEALKPLVLIAVAALLIAAPARAQGNAFDTYVNAAVRLYESLEYERALEQLEKAKKLSRGVDDDAVLFLYEGVFRMDLGQSEQARAAFKTALLLKPDASLQMKVSPKVRAELEQIREQVRKELAPMLARQDAERRKKADDEARRAEEQRRADATRAADANKAAEAAHLADVARLKAQDDERRKQAALDLQKSHPDAQRADLVPNQKPADVVTEPPQVKPSKFPVVPVVILGIGVAVAGTGAYFGVTSTQQVAQARGLPFQDETRLKLADAQSNATIANVFFVAAAVAGIGALIGFILNAVGGG